MFFKKKKKTLIIQFDYFAMNVWIIVYYYKIDFVYIDIYVFHNRYIWIFSFKHRVMLMEYIAIVMNLIMHLIKSNDGVYIQFLNIL